MAFDATCYHELPSRSVADLTPICTGVDWDMFFDLRRQVQQCPSQCVIVQRVSLVPVHPCHSQQYCTILPQASSYSWCPLSVWCVIVTQLFSVALILQAVWFSLTKTKTKLKRENTKRLKTKTKMPKQQNLSLNESASNTVLTSATAVPYGVESVTNGRWYLGRSSTHSSSAGLILFGCWQN